MPLSSKPLKAQLDTSVLETKRKNDDRTEGDLVARLDRLIARSGGPGASRRR